MPKKAGTKPAKVQKKIKKEKKVKDPNAPKRALTSFLYFIQKKQKDFKDQNPKLAHKDVIAKMGEAWKSMTEKDKKVYNDMAQVDKARYEKEKAAYTSGQKKVSKKKSDE